MDRSLFRWRLVQSKLRMRKEEVHYCKDCNLDGNDSKNKYNKAISYIYERLS